MPKSSTTPLYPCPKCGKPLRPRSKGTDGRPRWECRSGSSAGGTETYCYSTKNPESLAHDSKGNLSSKPRAFKRELGDSSVYIITAAQNATPVHEVFWNCLLTAAKHRGAELLVVPIRYKNPTSEWSASQANEEQWAPEVTRYLWNIRKALNKNLVLLGDVKTQPTANSPLTGFDAISGGSSAILGHTKMQFRCIPAPSNRMAKILTTTGACTVPNYTDSKAGKLGSFHHSLAALIVEIDGGKFHLRQLNFNNRTQSFTDLDTTYFEDRTEKAPRALALVMGDTHVDFVSKQVEQATFGPGGIVETLQPEKLVWHDLLDGYSVNPHHRGDPFFGIAKSQSGHGSVVDEVRRACQYVKKHTPAGCQSVVVSSNHDDFLRRWIVTHDWKTDPHNAEFYLKLALEMVQKTRLTQRGTEYPSPFPMVFPKIVDTSNIRLLEVDESCTIGGIEVGMHGDRGPNGARGSVMNHRRLGVKSIIGHVHSPAIEEGAYACGTSTNLRLDYNRGPSSWLNAHTVIAHDGKRQIIVIADGTWRAHKPKRQADVKAAA